MYGSFRLEYPIAPGSASPPNQSRDFLQYQPFLGIAGQIVQDADFLCRQIPLMLIQLPGQISTPDLPQRRVLEQFLQGAALDQADGPLGHVQKQRNFSLR
jgi:hypothetical protein